MRSRLVAIAARRRARSRNSSIESVDDGDDVDGGGGVDVNETLASNKTKRKTHVSVDNIFRDNNTPSPIAIEVASSASFV
jgi:hypothetical protein